jgi:hypothetical protein
MALKKFLLTNSFYTVEEYCCCNQGLWLYVYWTILTRLWLLRYSDMWLLLVLIKEYFKFTMFDNFLVTYINLYFFGMQDDWFNFWTTVCRLICLIEIFLIPCLIQL